MCYRPTVRYDETFRTYVDTLFHATTLDRNQIIRAALYASAHSITFRNLIKEFVKLDAPPFPLLWHATDHQLWKEQMWIKEEEKGDVIDDHREVIGTTGIEQSEQKSIQQRSIERPSGKVHSTVASTVTRGSSGGIKITIH